MAEKKLSEFESASLLTGSEKVSIIQYNSNKNTLLSSIKTFVLGGVSSLILTGLTISNAVVVATDTVFEAFGKLQGQINSILTSISSMSTSISSLTSMFGSYTPPLIIARSAVAVNAPNDTNENVLATITIPANTMGANGVLEIKTLWSYTNSANNKTLRARFGGISGSIYLLASLTTTASYQGLFSIRNRNSTNSQVGHNAQAYTVYAVSTGTVTTSSVDTTQAQTIVLTGQKATAGETITLESYTVEVIK